MVRGKRAESGNRSFTIFSPPGKMCRSRVNQWRPGQGTLWNDLHISPPYPVRQQTRVRITVRRRQGPPLGGRRGGMPHRPSHTFPRTDLNGVLAHGNGEAAIPPRCQREVGDRGIWDPLGGRLFRDTASSFVRTSGGYPPDHRRAFRGRPGPAPVFQVPHPGFLPCWPYRKR